MPVVRSRPGARTSVTDGRAHHESLRYHMRHLVKNVSTAWASEAFLCKLCGRRVIPTDESADAEDEHAMQFHMDVPDGFTSESVAALTTLFMIEKAPHSLEDGILGIARRYFGERERWRERF